MFQSSIEPVVFLRKGRMLLVKLQQLFVALFQAARGRVLELVQTHGTQVDRQLIVLVNVDGAVHAARKVRAVFEAEEVTDLVREDLTRAAQQFVAVRVRLGVGVARAPKHAHAPTDRGLA